VDVRFKLHVCPVDGFRVAQKQVAARFKIFIKPLDQLRLALFRKINQHVHAEDAIELAHVHNLRKVHRRESNQVANARTNRLMSPAAEQYCSRCR